MESEIAGLQAQLQRRDSDKAQWLEAEWVTRVQRLEVQLCEQKSRADSSRRSHSSACTALTTAEAERDAALQRARGAEAALETRELELTRVKAEALEKARRLGTRDLMVERRDAKLAALPLLQAELQVATAELAVLKPRAEELESQVRLLEEELQAAEEKLASRLSTIRKFVGMQGGRPVMNRDDDELQDCEASQASHCESRMTARVLAAVGEVGVFGCVSSDALMDALTLGEWLETVWESQAMWGLRMIWLRELCDDLKLVWSPQLTLKLRDKLMISYDKVDHLRFELSFHRVGKTLRPRPWAKNPWSGEVINFPQPLAPRSQWTPLVKAAEARYGLSISGHGKVASRSWLLTVLLQWTRDGARGLLQEVTQEQPFISVLGADATGIGKVGLTHVAISCAPSYRVGIAQQNEMNLNTIAASQTDDHWEGLDKVLAGGFYSGEADELSPTCIAAEIDAAVKTGYIEDSTTRIRLFIRVHGCFDLVAARGIRGGRGRCACHCDCDTEDDRWSCPLIAAGCDDWDDAEEQLMKHALLDNTTMRSDSHTPPSDWDFATQGLWRCSRSGCGITFDSWEAWRVSVKTFFKLKADKSEAGKKAAAKRAKAYAILHPSGQGEHMCPLTMLAMLYIIIDPLHCLILNLPKVIWKYSFGDRMVNDQRELVAQYLTEIGLPHLTCVTRKMDEMQTRSGSRAPTFKSSWRGLGLWRILVLGWLNTSKPSWI